MAHLYQRNLLSLHQLSTIGCLKHVYVTTMQVVKSATRVPTAPLRMVKTSFGPNRLVRKGCLHMLPPLPLKGLLQMMCNLVLALLLFLRSLKSLRSMSLFRRSLQMMGNLILALLLLLRSLKALRGMSLI